MFHYMVKKKKITCMAGAILYVCNVRFRMFAAQVRGIPHYRKGTPDLLQPNPGTKLIFAVLSVRLNLPVNTRLSIDRQRGYALHR